MTKKIFLCILLICSMLFGCICYAEGEIAEDKALIVEINVENCSVTVDGCLDTEVANKRIILTVYEKENAVTNLPTTTNEQGFASQILYLGQTTTDAEGNYEFAEFIPEDDSGWYVFQITVNGSNNKYSKEAYISSITDRNTFIENFYKTDASAIRTLLNGEVESSVVGINMKLYSMLSDAQRLIACNEMISIATKDGKAEDVATIYERINKASANTGILNFENADALLKYFHVDTSDLAQEQKEVVKEILNSETVRDVSVIKKFYGLTSDEQLNVIKKLKIKNYENSAEIYEGLYDIIVIDDVSKVESWNEVTSVLKGYSDVLTEIDFTKYEDSKYKNDIAKAIVDNFKFSTRKELSDFINEKLKNGFKNNSNQSSLTGSSGGKSPSIHGGGGVSVPKVEINTETNINNEDVRRFDDVNTEHWAYGAVDHLVKQGVINGKSDKLFCPNDTVTREEFIKMVVTALDYKDTMSDSPFNDVKKGDWYYDYVLKGCKNGLINGVSENMFGIGQPITRQDMAVIVMRAIKDQTSFDNDLSTFEDESLIADYAKESVSAMKSLKILSGYEDNTFRPFNSCSRAEAAKVIYNLVMRCSN